jgi:hypothetical protein
LIVDGIVWAAGNVAPPRGVSFPARRRYAVSRLIDIVPQGVRLSQGGGEDRANLSFYLLFVNGFETSLETIFCS